MEGYNYMQIFIADKSFNEVFSLHQQTWHYVSLQYFFQDLQASCSQILAAL